MTPASWSRQFTVTMAPAATYLPSPIPQFGPTVAAGCTTVAHASPSGAARSTIALFMAGSPTPTTSVVHVVNGRKGGARGHAGLVERTDHGVAIDRRRQAHDVDEPAHARDPGRDGVPYLLGRVVEPSMTNRAGWRSARPGPAAR
jgi:hypothetical protein